MVSFRDDIAPKRSCVAASSLPYLLHWKAKADVGREMERKSIKMETLAYATSGCVSKDPLFIGSLQFRKRNR